MNGSKFDMWRLALYSAGLVSAVFLLVQLWSKMVGPKPTDKEAIRFHGCLKDGDIACLWNFIGNEDKKEYALTKDKLDWLVNSYYLPKFKNSVVAPGMDSQMDPPFTNGSVEVATIYIDPSGVQKPMGLPVTPTPDGLVAQGFVYTIIHQGAVAGYMRSSYSNRREAYIQAFTAEGQSLTAHGFPGLYQPAWGPGITPWGEVVRRYQVGKATYERQMATQRAGG